MEEIIMKRLNCSKKEAMMITQDLREISPQLKPVVEDWLANDFIDTKIEAEGYSLDYLMKECGMQFTGAILTIDWLLKSPLEAKKAMAYGIR